MKKLFSTLVFITILLGFLPKNTFASDTWYFIVTAYYSPLPGQNYYITGNYESEKRLNWNGIAGASWKKVFSWMLAAPGKYAFGTKIQLDWLGVGSVDDRWGAIVPAWERGYGHDRIDVWVGSGDEGLRRAMYWGKRKVSWKVISKHSNISLDYTNIPAPKWAVPKSTILYGNKVQVAQNIQKNEGEKSDIFSISLWRWSDEKYVSELQDILRDIWYYNNEHSDGIYNTETINAIYNFQINNEIVLDETSKWAGSYGPQTRKKLEEIYNLYLNQQQQELELKQNIDNILQESNLIATQAIELLWKPVYWDISPEVRQAQKILSKLWYFEYKDTAIFGVKTYTAVLNFQLENNIITDIYEVWAWTFWPNTRKVMTQKLWEYYFQTTLSEKWLQEKYNKLNSSELVKDEKESAKNDVLILSI